MMYGLVDSEIDKWFNGPVPKFSPEDLGVSGPKATLTEILERARQVASDPTKLAWRNVSFEIFFGFRVLTISCRISGGRT